MRGRITRRCERPNAEFPPSWRCSRTRLPCRLPGHRLIELRLFPPCGPIHVTRFSQRQVLADVERPMVEKHNQVAAFPPCAWHEQALKVQHEGRLSNCRSEIVPRAGSERVFHSQGCQLTGIERQNVLQRDGYLVQFRMRCREHGRPGKMMVCLCERTVFLETCIKDIKSTFRRPAAATCVPRQRISTGPRNSPHGSLKPAPFQGVESSKQIGIEEAVHASRNWADYKYASESSFSIACSTSSVRPS